jgi:hypothetical protein
MAEPVGYGRSLKRPLLTGSTASLAMTLTQLGAAGESLGMDRHLKSNTVKRRTHSLFRQGCMLYDLMPNMPKHRLKPLIQRYAEILQQSRVSLLSDDGFFGLLCTLAEIE